MKPQFFLKDCNSSTSKNTPTPKYAPSRKKVAKAMFAPGGLVMRKEDLRGIKSRGHFRSQLGPLVTGMDTIHAMFFFFFLYLS